MLLTTYATSSIDGGLDCSNLSIGVLNSMPNTPIARAIVFAGQQAHPVWALDRHALEIYCYVQAANYHYPDGAHPIQVNIHSSLVSDENTSCVVVDNIIWHTSEMIRASARVLISKMASPANLTKHWPASAPMSLPVRNEALRRAGRA
jgi:hypothetical protein